jgi:hypothetical protein
MAIIMLLALLYLLATELHATERPPALDPNDVPFGIDPNQYTADLLDFIVAEPNLSSVSTVYAHNKGGWETELAIVMADGTPTDHLVQKLTNKPVRDPNGGWNQGFQWAWTPPGEGIYYLELRLSTKGKPQWRGDARTVVVYSYGEDPPFLYTYKPDVPILRIAQVQRLWQRSVKLGKAMTKPTHVWR